MIQHWLYHKDDAKKQACAGTIVECSLFVPRDDLAFNILLMRREIKEREAKYLYINMLVMNLL